ncbi:MAG: alpha/beta fold hydrolase [Rhodospirillales bacterium]|nr:alpha/beta fold hydrolase [Rhodospirillales bacterium]
MLKLSHKEFGAGEPIIVMHGLFGSVSNWTGIAKKLAQSHRVITVDLRNHGASPWSSSMVLTEMAGDLVHFIDHHRLGKPAVLGHSLGGKVAMVLALEHPDRVGKLIAADIAPVTYPPSLKSYIKAMQAIDVSSLSRRSEVEEKLKPVVPEAAVRAFLMQNLETTGNSLRWRINLDALETGMDDFSTFPAETAGRHYQGPTLFVSGGKSTYVKKSHHKLISKMFPQVQFEEIHGAGHWLHAEKPGEFLQIVTDFLG